MKPPLFSIIHASARPNGWRRAHDAWINTAGSPWLIEYILCIDAHGPFGEHFPEPISLRGEKFRLCINGLRQCPVDAWNGGAEASRGRILIMNSDDFFPHPLWDRKLRETLPGLDIEAVIEVSTGADADNKRLMTIQILTRKRYERYGYVFWPEYTSLYSDNDFTECARKDGVVIDARHLLFEHHHPTTCRSAWDDVYSKHNNPETIALGAAIFERRKAMGFPDQEMPL